MNQYWSAIQPVLVTPTYQYWSRREVVLVTSPTSTGRKTTPAEPALRAYGYAGDYSYLHAAK